MSENVSGPRTTKTIYIAKAETPTISADLTLPMPGYHVFAYDNNRIEAVTSLEASEVALSATSLEGDLVSVDTACSLCCM